MFARLRALERKLIHELAELAVTEQVEDLTGRWSDAIEEDRTPPGALDFARDVVRAGFPLPTLPRAINYLSECYYGKSLPDPRRLFQILLPWSAHPLPAWT